MYEVIRRIHLYAAMVLLTFVVMYFVTGYVIIHPNLPPQTDPRKTTSTVAIELPPSPSLDGTSIRLQEALDLPGKRIPPRKLNDGRARFLYTRPGTSDEVTVSAGGDSATIVHTETGLRQTLVLLHRMHNYGGGWLYDIWVLLYDLASASMILFGLSGIYLWYRLTRKRLIGWLVLALGYGYTAATVLFLVHAR